jgi:hypothetical protein
MNGKVVGYWICTALVAFAIGSGGVTELMRSGDVVAHIIAPLVIAGITAASWALRPPARRLKLA